MAKRHLDVTNDIIIKQEEQLDDDIEVFIEQEREFDGATTDDEIQILGEYKPIIKKPVKRRKRDDDNNTTFLCEVKKEIEERINVGIDNVSPQSMPVVEDNYQKEDLNNQQLEIKVKDDICHNFQTNDINVKEDIDMNLLPETDICKANPELVYDECSSSNVNNASEITESNADIENNSNTILKDGENNIEPQNHAVFSSGSHTQFDFKSLKEKSRETNFNIDEDKLCDTPPTVLTGNSSCGLTQEESEFSKMLITEAVSSLSLRSSSNEEINKLENSTIMQRTASFEIKDHFEFPNLKHLNFSSETNTIDILEAFKVIMCIKQHLKEDNSNQPLKVFKDALIQSLSDHDLNPTWASNSPAQKPFTELRTFSDYRRASNSSVEELLTELRTLTNCRRASKTAAEESSAQLSTFSNCKRATKLPNKEESSTRLSPSSAHRSTSKSPNNRQKTEDKLQKVIRHKIGCHKRNSAKHKRIEFTSGSQPYRKSVRDNYTQDELMIEQKNYKTNSRNDCHAKKSGILANSKNRFPAYKQVYISGRYRSNRTVLNSYSKKRNCSRSRSPESGKWSGKHSKRIQKDFRPNYEMPQEDFTANAREFELDFTSRSNPGLVNDPFTSSLFDNQEEDMGESDISINGSRVIDLREKLNRKRKFKT